MPIRTQKVSVKLDFILINFCIRFYRRDACPWASLSSCVQMGGSVSGQADSSPIPTITVTRHPSVSKHFGPSALWATEAPQRPPSPPIPLNKPSTYCLCRFFPAVAQTQIHVYTSTSPSVQLPCTCSCGVECTCIAMFCIRLVKKKKNTHHVVQFNVTCPQETLSFAVSWTVVQVECRLAVLFPFMVLRSLSGCEKTFVQTFCCVVHVWRDGR